MLDKQFDLAEAHRRISNILRFGTIAQVQGNTARVQLDDGWQSDFLPVRQSRSARTRSWSAAVVGEQVAVFSPSGETGAGVIVRGWNRDTFAVPSDNPDLDILFLGDDGGEDTYDLAQHIRTITAPVGGKVLIIVGSATVTVEDGSASVVVGSSTVTIHDGQVAVQANAVSLAGGGAAVARVGDQVDLNTGKIITGSGKVTAG